MNEFFSYTVGSGVQKMTNQKFVLNGNKIQRHTRGGLLFGKWKLDYEFQLTHTTIVESVWPTHSDEHSGEIVLLDTSSNERNHVYIYDELRYFTSQIERILRDLNL